MYFVGLDVHQRTSSICILDQHGKVVKQQKVRGGWDQLIGQLEQAPRPMAVCFEASTGCGWLFDRLKPMARRIEVAHPGQVRLIFRAKRKNDRVDAFKLAKLLFLDQVPKAYIPDASVRAWRSTVEFRRRTVQKRTRVKNALRTLLRGCGVQAQPVRRSMWTARGVEALRQIELPDDLDVMRREMLLTELAMLDGQIKQIEKRLDELAGDHAGVALLRTIPGIGPRTAEAILAYVDKPDRFRRNKQIGAYFGLVPCQDASAQSNRLGHITRQGPSTVRGLIVEASWQAIRHSPTIRAQFERLCQGKKQRRRIALVAIAHHLLRVSLSMLKSGEVWREEEQDMAFPPEGLEGRTVTAMTAADG